MEAVARTVAERRPDGLIVAGDLATRRRLAHRLADLDALGLPVYLVRGNCEGRGFDEQVKRCANLTRLTAKPIRCGKLHLSGLGGTLPLPFASRIRWREAALLGTLAPAPRANILVIHPPPYGVLDEVLGGLHSGSRGLARWIVRHRPELVLCGHIHERPGVATLGVTTVVNCAMGRHGGGALIESDPGNHRIEMLPPVTS